MREDDEFSEVDNAQEEADMWHQKYLDLLKKIKELAEAGVGMNIDWQNHIIREEKAWQENYNAEQEIVREADA